MAKNEDEIYRLENVPVFEAIYGKGLISLGGYDAAEQMFDGLELNGEHLLDIGSGIGGIAHHLAAKLRENAGRAKQGCSRNRRVR